MATLPSSHAADPTLPAGGMNDQSLALSLPDTKENETTELIYFTAFHFGWQTCLHYGRPTSIEPVTFESVENELEEQWSQRHAATAKQLPWEAARETARDAWDRVFDALAEDSRPKG